ncbi:amidase [Thalassotalea psychrophila]|uniref:Amidase n=1 Tax=Thalassotalea psychrophila TaxID=3065647 RepID=A0ABY9TTH9_9GAMM|nr:amidase [Colwelliaceae bacterium SQ149]
MTVLDILSLDFTGQLQLIERGELLPDELIQMQLKYNQQLNPVINAFIAIDEQPPLIKDALPLSGVSIAVKDNIDVLGFNTTAGMLTRKNSQAKDDAFVIKKLKAAGANINGKLNMHEGALGATNDNPHYGKCLNPHLLSHTPGGSSGGSGASVAAAMTPMALGSDTMGSVRIPAAYCGVFGLKASTGAISIGGSVVCSHQLDHIGPITRSARDLRLALDYMNGYDADCKQSKIIKFKAEQAVYNIAAPSNLAELGVDTDIITTFEQQLTLLVQAGHQITRFILEFDFAAARRAGLLICEADMLVEHKNDFNHRPELFSKQLYAMLTFVKGKDQAAIDKAKAVISRAGVLANQLFEQADILVMPTAPQTAFNFTDKVPANQADLTSFANLAELAALTAPMPTKGLPIGIQFVGEEGSDYQLIGLAEQYQILSNWQFSLPQPIVDLLSINAKEAS